MDFISRKFFDIIYLDDKNVIQLIYEASRFSKRSFSGVYPGCITKDECLIEEKYCMQDHHIKMLRLIKDHNFKKRLLNKTSFKMSQSGKLALSPTYLRENT